MAKLELACEPHRRKAEMIGQSRRPVPMISAPIQFAGNPVAETVAPHPGKSPITPEPVCAGRQRGCCAVLSSPRRRNERHPNARFAIPRCAVSSRNATGFPSSSGASPGRRIAERLNPAQDGRRAPAAQCHAQRFPSCPGHCLAPDIMRFWGAIEPIANPTGCDTPARGRRKRSGRI